jgi:hypothetical protein
MAFNHGTMEDGDPTNVESGVPVLGNYYMTKDEKKHQIHIDS